MRKIELIGLAVVFSTGLSFADVTVLLTDNFCQQDPSWVLCGPSGHKAVVSGESLKLTVSDITTFSTTGYLPFETVALQDGQTLRLIVDVDKTTDESFNFDLISLGSGISSIGLDGG